MLRLGILFSVVDIRIFKHYLDTIKKGDDSSLQITSVLDVVLSVL